MSLYKNHEGKKSSTSTITYNFSLCQVCVLCLHVLRKRCISTERAELGSPHRSNWHTQNTRKPVRRDATPHLGDTWIK